MKLKDFLKTEFNRRKTKNKYYSLRKFAYDLKVSPALISRIFNDKISVTRESVEKIEKSLELPDYLKSKNYNRRKSWSDAKIKNIQLNLNSVEYFHWYFLAIIELCTMGIEDLTTEKISYLLQVNIKDIRSALKVLEKNKSIYKNTNNVWLASSEEHYVMIESKLQEKLKIEFLKKVTKYMEKNDQHAGCFSGGLIGIRKDILPDVNLRINRFVKNLGRYIHKKSKGSASNLCFLQVGITPISKNFK